jgi:hypothetical protein
MLRDAGKAGSTSLKLPFLDPTGLVAWQAHTQGSAEAAAGPGTGSLLLLASPSKRCWRGIQTHINNAVHGVMQVGAGVIQSPNLSIIEATYSKTYSVDKFYIAASRSHIARWVRDGSR